MQDDERFRQVCDSLQKLADGMNEAKMQADADRLYVRMLVNYLAINKALDETELRRMVAMFVRIIRDQPGCSEDQRRVAERIEATYVAVQPSEVLLFKPLTVAPD